MKVFLTGGDNMNWALDEDLRLVQRSIEDVVELTDFELCDVVHSVWWEALLRLPPESIIKKRVLCNFSSRPFHYMKQPQFCKVLPIVGLWIARSKEAEVELHSVGIDCVTIPYVVDTAIFTPLPKNSSALIEMRQHRNIPRDCYLIGNFHRDTEGGDLCSPKLLKGPDIFVEILKALRVRNVRIHVLLAGPRRFWIRRRLEELGIPFSFVGEIVEAKDDIDINVLPRQTLNVLYNLLDLYIITSRCEGGPHSVMEAAASRCKVISTRAGLAEDILAPECIYDTPLEAVEIIEKDVSNDYLRTTLTPHYTRIIQNYRVQAVAPLYKTLYENIETVPIVSEIAVPRKQETKPSTFKRLLYSLGRQSPQKALPVSIFHKFREPPWGGGNQFMIALKNAIQRQGGTIFSNIVAENIQKYILDAIWFDRELLRELSKIRHKTVIQRIDGPISLIRGKDQELDDLCFHINTQFASATVIQSAWTYQRIIETGYQPVNPIIIHNAVDPDIFHRQGHISFDRKRKIRLISTSWSANPRKGGATYKWIEKHLDWDRFEYTFVGNSSEQFDRIHHIPPVSSEKLAEILRQHDVYITASQNDPCSNALIEALACGLPTLYLNSGGHPELVSYGGLPFNHEEEIFPQLEILVENYEMFQNLITVPGIDEVAKKYLTLLREVSL